MQGQEHVRGLQLQHGRGRGRVSATDHGVSGEHPRHARRQIRASMFGYWGSASYHLLAQEWSSGNVLIMTFILYWTDLFVLFEYIG